MREIKFRGRWNGKWVYGGIEIRHNGETLIGGNGVWSVVDSKTVGQFTNLKDKNGNDVYEGDVVRSEEHPERFVMKEEEGGGCGCCSRETVYGWYFPGYSTPESSEVIGNIYENPELCPTS